MSLLLVVVSGLVIGYWLTSRFLTPGDPPPEPPAGGDGNDDPSVAEDARPRHWSEVLDLPADADATAFAAAYRRALAQYRPDGMQDMAPELQALARARTAQIEAAYLEALRDLHR